MTETHSFGYWVRRRRKALDLTQAELAERIGCAEVTIRRIEADERRPSQQLAALLADQLQIPAEQRAAFLKAARAELATDQLATPLPPPASPIAPTPELPIGTVTFLFTDIVGSTHLWERHRDAMPAALARHDTILREAIAAHDGVVFKTVGDGIYAAFASAPQALAAALAAQRTLQAEPWQALTPADTPKSKIQNPKSKIAVRMALHTGTAALREGEYLGLALSRVARLLAAGHGGQVLISQATQELVRNHVPPGVELHDLGTHHLKDLTRAERIFQLGAAGLQASFPALQTRDERLGNLPAQPTALIGREREIAALCALLRRADRRLVTLTGAGGTGKTRLALQVAADLLAAASPPLPSQWERGQGGEGHFPDGTWFVNLAPISDPELVLSAIASALGVPESGSRPLLDAVKSYLREKRILLLLDNFEQVLDAAPLVAELLAAAHGLKVLVTSRAALHLRGEHEFAVPPLTLPDRGSMPLERLTQYEAVRLFIDRAQAARSDFAITNANAPAVAEICHRLDGLPLAIELAAARIKLFPPEALLARLSNRLALLTSGPRDLPARQQTLRNTIDWSYDLLSPQSQALFRRLGVFVGGCTLEAVEAVCKLRIENEELRNTAYDDVVLNSQFSIFNSVEALVDQSLLRREDGVDDEPRFTMLETVREYALDRLVAKREEEVLRRRHAAYFLTLAERVAREQWRAKAVNWLNRLDRDYDNLPAAFAWSAAVADTADLALRFAGALGHFLNIRGHANEKLTWMRRLLAISHNLAMPVRAAVLRMAAVTESLQGDSVLARALSDEALALYRALGDKAALARSLTSAGRIARDHGDFDRAAVLVEEGLTMSQQEGDISGITWAFLSLGDVALDQGDVTTATKQFQEALTLAQQQGDNHAIGWALVTLGRAAYAQDDTSRAQVLLTESMTLFRDLGAKDSVEHTLFELGRVAYRQGDVMRAAALFAESLPWPPESEDKRDLAYSLAALAAIAGERRQLERAACLFGAAEALRESVGHPLPPVMRTEYDQAVAATRAQLDADAFAAAWAEGRAMTVEQAVAYALEER